MCNASPRAYFVIVLASFATSISFTPVANGWTTNGETFCFSCTGNNPYHPVGPDSNPPSIPEIDEDTPVDIPVEVTGTAFLPEPQVVAVSNLGTANRSLAVTISHTADIAALAEKGAPFGFGGAGSEDFLWFGNDPHLFDFGFEIFTPYLPPFPSTEEMVAGYAFRSHGDGPKYKTFQLPSEWRRIEDDGSTRYVRPVDIPLIDGELALWIDGTAYDLSVDETFDFTTINPAGVDSFAVTGFAADEMRRINTPMPFTYGATFMSDGIVQSVILPLVSNPVPEPTTGGLACLTILGSVIAMSRPKRLPHGSPITDCLSKRQSPGSRVAPPPAVERSLAMRIAWVAW